MYFSSQRTAKALGVRGRWTRWRTSEFQRDVLVVAARKPSLTHCANSLQPLKLDVVATETGIFAPGGTKPALR